MLSTNLMVFFQALGNIKFTALIGIMQGITNLFIISIGYLFGVVNIKYILIAMIIFQAVALFLILVASLKSGLIFGNFSKDMAKTLIITGLKQHTATISTFVYAKVNQLIVFRYSGELQAGILAVPLSLAMFLMVIPMTFQTVLYPRVIHSNDDYEITVRSLRIGFYGWGGVIILIMLLAKPILLAYGGTNFLPSVNVFRILLIAVWFLPLSSFLAPYYVKKGAFITASFSAVLLGIVSIIINILLVPKYASIGAALATAFTCLIGFCIVILFLYYLSKKNPIVVFKPDFKKEICFLKQISLRSAQ
jgi:O-antigen/teichoic acid export membrane protein